MSLFSCIRDITNGDDEYAPIVPMGVPPWDLDGLQAKVEEVYLTDERDLAVRPWDLDVAFDAIIEASLIAHASHSRDDLVTANRAHVERHGMEDLQGMWVRYLNNAAMANDPTWKKYHEGIKRVAEQRGHGWEVKRGSRSRAVQGG